MRLLALRREDSRVLECCASVQEALQKRDEGRQIVPEYALPESNLEGYHIADQSEYRIRAQE